MIGYFVYKLGEFLASLFPLPIAYKIGNFFATLQFLVSKKDRQAVIRNLELILPQEEKATAKKRAREVFVNFGLYLAEFFRYKKIDKNFVQSRVALEGLEHVEDCLKSGKGGILLTAHLGNWELGGMALGLLGYPIVAIALDHKNKKINEFFKVRRESKGVGNISLGLAIKQCFRALKQNKLVAILGDRDFSKSGYELDFLGKTKIIPRGPAVLALHLGSPIVPVFVIREPNKHVVMRFLQPILFDANTEEKELVRRYATIIEDHIRQYPTQWLMFREFWKE